MELEANLADFQREMQAGAPTREKRSPADWIPRPPEKYALTGHRAPVTKVGGRVGAWCSAGAHSAMGGREWAASRRYRDRG